jgi:hypothetical protein
MIWNQHSDLVGKHAFLSASKYHWINYDEEKIVSAYDKHMTAALGTRLHAFAADAIKLGIKLPNTQQTLNMYVNDCIGYRMSVEQVLFFSYNAFGTADAINFQDRVLRIFDLKNGVTATKETQLEIYAAYFCLEYKVSPLDIEYDLRIYQNDDIENFDTDPEDIAYIMSRIKEFDALIEAMKKEV